MLSDEQAAIERRQRIAQAMMAQGQEPLETNQVAGGYVVPVSPLAAVGKVAQQMAGAWMGKKADEDQARLNSDKTRKLVEAMQGESLDFGKLAEAGTSPEVIAKIIVDKQAKRDAMAQKLEEKRLEMALPTNDMRNATWAAGGDEGKARELLSNKLQNPLGMLNYQLQAGNAAANQDIQRQNLELRRQEVARKSEPSDWQMFQIQQKQEKQAKEDEERNKQRQQASISAQQVLDQAELLNNHPGRQMGTGVSSFLSKIPGTPARDFQANLETFKAQTFVPMVQALKGMGALSDAEGKKLSDSVGALDPAMSEQAFQESLKQITSYLYQKAATNGLEVTLPEFAASGINIDIKHPENLSPEDRAALQADIEKEQSKNGGLSPAEQAELEQLRARFGKR